MQRQNLHHAVVDLNLQLVDRVFFIQHSLGKLLVGVQHRMHRLVHGALRQAAHPEQPFFQLIQVSFEVTFHEIDPLNARTARQVSASPPHPNRPVMYASVRGSLGVVNNCGVGLNSIICPVSKNAVKSLTRAACCMLCVTITMVQRSFNCTNSSSIFAVLMGSSAEHGSSSSRTSGSTANARAIHSRCCCPPESSYADLCRWSFSSSQSAECRRLFSTASAIGSFDPFIRSPYATLSNIDFGNGFGRWKTMPTRRRNCVTSCAKMLCPSSVISPSKRAWRTISCIRFSVRSKVDFPQPDGPISAVTLLVATPRLTSNKTCFDP